jgi:two-component system chemotaxis response regulator CheB
MDAGCPNCCGVLAVEELGEDGMLLFRCRVGHTYNEQSLLEAKEEQLETSLWTTIEIFEELVSLHEEFAKRALGTRQAALAREYQRRAREAAQQLKRMREIVASDGPPAGLPRERHNGDPS